jgi:Bacterial alpha-L-rhamnosidase.
MSEYKNKLKNTEAFINTEFIKKVDQLKPVLIETRTDPVSVISLGKGENGDWRVSQKEPFDELKTKTLLKNDTVYLDFGEHQVGYLTLEIHPLGFPADSPVHLQLCFGETLTEMMASPSDYKGWLSESWFQEEFVHIDAVPTAYRLPRRYAFRYLSVKILNSTSKYQVRIADVFCTQVTSGDKKKIPGLRCSDRELCELDKVGIRTLQDCMQCVFEDGPKRDRRLWIGDLRLQALANYETFKNIDLVKRCLYLFAGMTGKDGRVSACQYVEPEYILGDNVLYDYSLFFVACLYDYYHATYDDLLVGELWNVAWRQVELSIGRLDKNFLVLDSDDWWCFLDWGDGLNKQAGAQAVLIYTMRMAKELASHFATEAQIEIIDKIFPSIEKAAVEFLWDEKRGVFISGSERQVSATSQVWMVLARVLPDEKNRELCTLVLEKKAGMPLVTPYMYHYLVEAMLQCGMKAEASELMKDYWGGMIRNGADTFWEVYDPENPDFSPYGSPAINSYCHAWSCTPTYFIRKYFQNRK